MNQLMGTKDLEIGYFVGRMLQQDLRINAVARESGRYLGRTFDSTFLPASSVFLLDGIAENPHKFQQLASIAAYAQHSSTPLSASVFFLLLVPPDPKSLVDKGPIKY